ncbi:hypothetical protein GCM10010873_01390 [Cypionkella aquatica]|uniref:Uncharacterized protein n=1 Tax=Cypionkella aquatica TaxID=1756042 RepID=A0AA37U2P1_9RHOB|nr:hypothetical protein GCM10010873_01390 [Cypionkella aquatica]
MSGKTTIKPAIARDSGSIKPEEKANIASITEFLCVSPRASKVKNGKVIAAIIKTVAVKASITILVIALACGDISTE